MSVDPHSIESALRRAQNVPVGNVVTGTENALHALCNVLRDLVHKSPHVYHEEAQVLAARNAIDEYEKSVYGTLRYLNEVVRFDDRSGHEDVSSRVPAPGAPNAGQAPIDYDQLAAAILRVQRNGPAIEPSSVVTGAEQAAAQGGGPSL